MRRCFWRASAYTRMGFPRGGCAESHEWGVVYAAWWQIQPARWLAPSHNQLRMSPGSRTPSGSGVPSAAQPHLISHDQAAIHRSQSAGAHRFAVLACWPKRTHCVIMVRLARWSRLRHHCQPQRLHALRFASTVHASPFGLTRAGPRACGVCPHAHPRSMHTTVDWLCDNRRHTLVGTLARRQGDAHALCEALSRTSGSSRAAHQPSRRPAVSGARVAESRCSVPPPPHSSELANL